jgi:predicted SprT family Zn-dependent metalloprotease
MKIVMNNDKVYFRRKKKCSSCGHMMDRIKVVSGSNIDEAYHCSHCGAFLVCIPKGMIGNYIYSWR